MAVGTLTDHGVKGLGQGHDAHGLRYLVPMQAVRISRPVGALMVPAHDFWNLRPGKLHLADDLMSDDRVVPHLPGFLLVELRSFSQQPLIDGNHADVVEIGRRPQGRNRVRVHPQRFADRL